MTGRGTLLTFSGECILICLDVNRVGHVEIGEVSSSPVSAAVRATPVRAEKVSLQSFVEDFVPASEAVQIRLGDERKTVEKQISRRKENHP